MTGQQGFTSLWVNQSALDTETSGDRIPKVRRVRLGPWNLPEHAGSA